MITTPSGTVTDPAYTYLNIPAVTTVSPEKISSEGDEPITNYWRQPRRCHRDDRRRSLY